MECDKCKAQVEDNSRFCGKCGNNVKEKQFDPDDCMKSCKKLWFLIGSYRGNCLAQKDTDSLKKFERLLEKEGIMPEYLDAIKSLNDIIKLPTKNDN